MKPIKIQNITLLEFKELLNKISANTLKENIDLYYKEYIIKDKLNYLTFYLPTKEYVFCESNLFKFVGINFIDYKTILKY
jgi:hypothetical protein